MILGVCHISNAALFTLPVLDPTQIEPIFDVLASTVVFRSLEPPSQSKTFNIWFNARVSGTSASALSSILSSDTAVLPFGNLQGGVNGPFGLGIELGFFPRQSISGSSFGSFGGNLKWNFTSVLFRKFPFDSAIRFLYTSADLNFQQTISDQAITVEYDTTMTGVTVDISKNLGFFEPYVGYGMIRHSSSLTGHGTVSLFNVNFPVNTNTVENSASSGWLRAGCELRLILLTLGAQYDYAFGAGTTSVKLGFKF
jgi:hypothetical protein